MMPNTSVSPAASKNSSRPNCSPFRNCSTISSMSPPQRRNKTAAARKRHRCSRRFSRSLHRAFVVEAILVVLDDGGDGFQRKLAVGVLDHVLQIEILDRDVVLAVFERAAHRLDRKSVV